MIGNVAWGGRLWEGCKGESDEVVDTGRIILWMVPHLKVQELCQRR